MVDSDTTTIRNFTKGKPPSLPFVCIKEAILGMNYELGISFVSSKKQKEINKKYRNINKTTNILSFPISDESGDISLDLSKVKEDAHLFEMTYPQFLKYLLIHGLLHLKGMDHSAIMNRQEKKFLKMFS
ncbi:MAG: rRNA maturation RNase YbeY [Candidatus Paceibacterota bacterium]